MNACLILVCAKKQISKIFFFSSRRDDKMSVYYGGYRWHSILGSFFIPAQGKRQQLENVMFSVNDAQRLMANTTPAD